MLSLGIDSGTQSTKVIALDLETRHVIASAHEPHRFVEGLPPGHIEQEPEMWSAAAESAILACLAKLGQRREEVAAIGISAQQHGSVFLDHKGTPLCPAKLWCDTSTEPQCRELTQRFGGVEGLITLTGNPILPGYTAPKILQLKQNDPGRYSRVASILLPHDYLNFWLTGERRMEYGDASGTGLLDIRTRRWSEPLLNYIDPALAELLPTPGSSRLPFGLLRENLRSKWGFKHRPVVSAGGGDNMMAAIGSGSLTSDVATVSLGTSGTVFCAASEPIIDPQGEIAAFCDSNDGWLPLACIMNATVATEAVRTLLHWSHAEMDAAIASLPPGSEGVLFLPYLNGERLPNLPQATGSYHGLTPSNMTSAHFARATMEGVALGLARGLNRLRAMGITPREIRLTGGGAASMTWQQICTNAFNIPTVCLVEKETAALGAALQAASVAESTRGGHLPLAELVAQTVKVNTATRCQPFAEAVACYEELLERNTRLTQALYQP